MVVNAVLTAPRGAWYLVPCNDGSYTVVRAADRNAALARVAERGDDPTGRIAYHATRLHDVLRACAQ